jgi:hypothetical protein
MRRILLFAPLVSCASVSHAPPAQSPAAPAAHGLPERNPPAIEHAVWSQLASSWDADRDGRITRAEYGRDDAHFARLDTDGDGALCEQDLLARKLGAPAFDVGAPPAVGELAPDFELAELSSPGRVALRSFRGVRPVALLFGSFT